METLAQEGLALMPRKLTKEQKAYVKENAELGGVLLSEVLKVDKAFIYQYATDEGFSVKKGGRLEASEKRMSKLKKLYSKWPRNYRYYKKLIVQRDGLYCHYCDKLMAYGEAQVDHVVAKARGGSDAPDNLVLACLRCNSIKGTTCYSCPEFRSAIR
jgi:hypothetical protein